MAYKILKGRRKGVVASLIVLALIASFIGYMKSLYLEAKRENEEYEEAWLLHHQYPHPSFWWNFSSTSGFDMGYRDGDRMLTLLRGRTGSIKLVISTNACWALCPKLNACELSLYGTLDRSGSRAILPPGVKAAFTPHNVTLPAGGNVSVLYTITADPDAPPGCFSYGAGISLKYRINVTYFVGFWLVIGSYTPHGNFSLIRCPEDFIARDELNITEKVGAEIWRPSVESFFSSPSGGTYSFDIRSEGPPLNVTLEIVNIDVPEEVKLSVPQQVFVPAGSEVFVGVGIGYNANPEVGRTYHFQVICRSGDENILVIP